MGFNWTEGCYRNSTLTDIPFAVLVALARRADCDTGICWPTREQIAADCRWSEPTIVRALKALEASGEVTIDRQWGRGKRTTYTLNPVLLKGVRATPIRPEKVSERHLLEEEKVSESHPFPAEKVSESTPLAVDSLYINLSEEKEPVKDICPPKAEKEDDRFDEFWSMYPRKEKKKDARTAWAKLSKTDRVNALDKLPDFLPAYAACEPAYIPHPTTWLNGRRWEDNPPPVKPTQTLKPRTFRNHLKDPATPRRTNVIIDAHWRTS